MVSQTSDIPVYPSIEKDWRFWAPGTDQQICFTCYKDSNAKYRLRRQVRVWPKMTTFLDGKPACLAMLCGG